MDRSQFLERTRENRERRAMNLKREKSSVKIQSAWRSCKCRSLLRKEFSIELSLLISQGSPPTSPRPISLLLFCSSPLNSLSSESLLVLLDRVIATTIENASKGLPLLGEADGIDFTHCMSRLTRFALLVHRRLLASLSSVLSHPEPFFNCLRFFRLAMGSSSVKGGPASCQQIAIELCSSGFYDTMERLFTSKLSSHGGLSQEVLTVAVLPLQFSSGMNGRESIPVQFTLNLFSLPNFTRQLPRQLVSGLLVPLSPFFLGFDPSEETFDHMALFPISSNVCYLLGIVLEERQALNWPPTSFSPTSPLCVIITFLSKCLPFCRSKIIDLQSLSPLNQADTHSMLFSHAPTDFLPILCELFRNVLNIPGGKEWGNLKILNTLVFSSNIVRQLWEIVVTEKDEREPVVWFFAKSLAHMLYTMDDEEFFEMGESKQQLAALVRRVRDSLAQIDWTAKDDDDDEESDSDHEFSSMSSALISLQKQLYDRNSRHQFTEPTDWHHPVHSSSPKQSEQILLKYVPYAIPFDRRAEIFYQKIESVRGREQQMGWFLGSDDTVVIQVRRGYELEDGLAEMKQISHGILKALRVEFIGVDGLPEAGIDGGGPFKEFFEALLLRAFNSDYGLFKETAQRSIYPNPASSIIVPNHLVQFNFLGMLLGKAIYEGILVEIPFANFFLSKLLGKNNFFNDLVHLDQDLHRHLLYLKRDCEDPQDLGLTFSVANSDIGIVREVELVPHGSEIVVTEETKIEYVYRVAHHRLNTEIRAESKAFANGFWRVIPFELISMFNESELSLLIGGSSKGLDVADMRRNTKYSGGYSESHHTIQFFWDVISDLSPVLQRSFLRFVTGCSLPGLLGFSHMLPPFCVHLQSHPEAQTISEVDNYLPTASTCMNFLKLPPYSSKEILRSKLCYAIESKSGFELS